MAYTTIFFDLDGTLTDSSEGITKSVQYALAKFGIAEAAERLLPFVGPPLHHSFMAFYDFDEATARRAVGYYREYFAERGMYENTVYAGIPELLRALREAGRALSVVTTKPTFFAEQIVRHFALDGYFDRVIGAELDLTNSDKETLVRLALAHYPEVARESVVMIGDREHDIIGAHANGIASIGVTYGAGTLAALEAARPMAIVRSVAELGCALLG